MKISERNSQETNIENMLKGWKMNIPQTEFRIVVPRGRKKGAEDL
jgi:hypothetical protein